MPIKIQNQITQSRIQSERDRRSDTRLRLMSTRSRWTIVCHVALIALRLRRGVNVHAMPNAHAVHRQRWSTHATLGRAENSNLRKSLITMRMTLMENFMLLLGHHKNGIKAPYLINYYYLSSAISMYNVYLVEVYGYSRFIIAMSAQTHDALSHPSHNPS